MTRPIRKFHRFVILSIVAIATLAISASAVSYYGIFLPITTPGNNTTKVATLTPLECTTQLALNFKLAQKLMFAIYPSEILEEIPTLIKHRIGGVIAMGEIPKDSIDFLNKTMLVKPFVAVDQEGGTVQRYKSNGVLPSAEAIANLETPESAYNLYLSSSKNLKSNGITTNFAPVVDVISHYPNPIPTRMYSNHPMVVTNYAESYIKAMQQAGISPVIKHFPGLGSGAGNTDFISSTTDDFDTIKNRDLIPYQRLAKYNPDVMVGNMIVPGLTDNQPAIWSKKTVQLLRSLGYANSILYTDSLAAEAVPGTLAEAALKSWQAGIDVAVIVQDDSSQASLDSIVNGIIEITKSSLDSDNLDENSLDSSALRILEKKNIDPCKLALN